MPPALDQDAASWRRLSGGIQKSRSHLALFEAVDRSGPRCRQTEHHNAFGYLESYPVFSSSVSSSCHQLVRSSPESLFCRLPAESRPLSNSRAGRNESSAIFAVLGLEKASGDSLHSQTEGRQHMSPISMPFSSPSPVEKVFHSYRGPDLSSSPLSCFSRANRYPLDAHPFPKTSSPLAYLPFSANQFVFSVPSAMSENENSSQNRILIKGGKCVNDDAVFEADIYIEEGVIRDIGPHLIVPGGVKTIDARGLFVLPGGIDTHTHLNMPFMGTQTADDFYSGTRAALAGGTTTIMDFVIPEKGASLVETYKKWRSWADGVSCCDYAFRVAIPEFKRGKTDVEMETLTREFGINAFKCFMAYKDTLMLSDEELLGVFQKCRQIGALAMVHAENGDIIDYNVKKLKSLGVTGPEGHLQSRPEEVEAEATYRAIVMANQVNCPLYVVHVMSRSAADKISDARNAGVIVFGEPITAGIGTDGSHYFNKCWRHAAAHILSPPLRTDRGTSEHLINLLASGQLQATGSDHCTFNSDQKALGSKDFSKIPNGVNGVEERMVILFEKAVKTGKLDVKQFVAVTSTNAAKIFNIYPRKGRLAKGSDADIVLWGPRNQIIKAETHHSNVDFNIFEGMSVTNGPLLVISNGKIVLDESGFHVTQGNGRFVPCPPNSPYVYGAISQRAKVPPFVVDRSGKTAQAPAAAPPPAAAAAAATTDGKVAPPAPSALAPSNGQADGHLINPNDLANMTLRDPNDTSSSSFYKGTTRSGVRNLQDSSFNLSGQQVDDDKIGKTAIRVHNPPGGRSSGIW